MDELQKIIKHYDPKKNSNESDIIKIDTFKFFDYYICHFMGHAVAYVADYTMYNPDGYLWSIKEIEKHCEQVIDQLIRIFAGKR